MPEIKEGFFGGRAGLIRRVFRRVDSHPNKRYRLIGIPQPGASTRSSCFAGFWMQVEDCGVIRREILWTQGPDHGTRGPQDGPGTRLDIPARSPNFRTLPPSHFPCPPQPRPSTLISGDCLPCRQSPSSLPDSQEQAPSSLFYEIAPPAEHGWPIQAFFWLEWAANMLSTLTTFQAALFSIVCHSPQVRGEGVPVEVNAVFAEQETSNDPGIRHLTCFASVSPLESILSEYASANPLESILNDLQKKKSQRPSL